MVVTTAVLTEPDDEVAALLSHELVHWRTGDEITSAFVRGVGLPLTLAHALPTWLMRTFPHPGTNFVVFVFFWPVLLTMRYVVLPLHARDVRAAEYRADLGAVLTGHVDGLRRILERRLSFETGRSGWDEAVCATHPPHELRLDALERASLAGAPDGAAQPVDRRRAVQLRRPGRHPPHLAAGRRPHSGRLPRHQRTRRGAVGVLPAPGGDRRLLRSRSPTGTARPHSAT